MYTGQWGSVLGERGGGLVVSLREPAGDARGIDKHSGRGHVVARLKSQMINLYGKTFSIRIISCHTLNVHDIN